MSDTPAPVSLDDPRVQARAREKAEAFQAAADAHEKALMAGPQTVGKWTFHPPNSCTYDAILQPDVMALSQTRVRIILGYLLTLEPVDQIPAAADLQALRAAAARWQDSIEPADLPKILQIISGAYSWLVNRTTRENSFFLTQ